ncbi:hypothetical protein [Thermithiobacillus plumbiphilus]|uniref:Uncharacterized protein n=1 Tax=Thermithiobacillus plumbiphilus TaxID=1729899 RepID=A0ABU9D6D2_9PROT
MDRISAFAYTQARLQARQGMRPDTDTWRRLSATHDLAALLREARETTLRPWVLALEAGFTVHQLEAALRQAFRRHVAMTASWQPRDWRPAVCWVQHLPLLPALQHLLSGNNAYPWMADDPALKPYAQTEPGARLMQLQQSGLAPLANAWRADIPLLAGWRQHWRRLWPPAPKALGARLDALADAIENHLAAMADKADADGWHLRETMEAQLSLAFHHHIQQPMAVFLHLALVALDLERLRAALVERALFPATE